MAIINLVTFTSQIPATDASCGYLAAIFGPMNGVVCNQPGGGQTLTLLGTMFQTFNSIILAIAALMILYVTVVGVMQTAHEGEFMGKKWHNMWLPIRMVFGVAFLVPTATGYSALQIVMMWVIVQGIGAADMLWSSALGFINIGGSPYAQLSIPSTTSDIAVSQLFQGLVCDATARVSSADPTNTPNGGYYCNITKDATFCNTNVSASFSQNTSSCQGNTCSFNLGPKGQCGQLTYCNPDAMCSGTNAGTLQCATCRAQNTALPQLLKTLSDAATAFAMVDYNYRDFYSNSFNKKNDSSWSWIYAYCSKNNISTVNCCVRSSDPDLANTQSCPATSSRGSFNSPNSQNGSPQGPDQSTVKSIYLPFGLTALQPNAQGSSFLQVAGTFYSQLTQQALSEWVAAQGEQTSSLSGDLQKAKDTGWIFAGAYYYVIARMNNAAQQQALPTISVTLQDPNNTALGKYRNNYSAAQMLESAAQGAAANQGAFSKSGVPQLGVLQTALDGTMASLTSAANSALSSAGASTSGGNNTAGVGGNVGNNDPISTLMSWGNGLIDAGTTTISILIPITFALGIAGYISPFILGTGITNPAGGAIALIYMLLVPALYAFCGFLITFGATLAIYVPLIPYMIFTFGAIGWLISTVEAMVAGPLVALGIISPSGEHEIMGKAQPAIMLLFNVFLRPSLMIFGLMAAILIAKVVIGMINAVFWSVVKDAVLGASNGPMQFIIFLFAYVALVVAALNKCFAAIYIIPQQVMAWVSGQGSQYGEAEGLGEVKGKTEQAAQATGGAMAGAEGTSRGATDNRAKGKQLESEANKSGPGVSLSGDGGGDEPKK